MSPAVDRLVTTAVSAAATALASYFFGIGPAHEQAAANHRAQVECCSDLHELAMECAR